MNLLKQKQYKIVIDLHAYGLLSKFSSPLCFPQWIYLIKEIKIISHQCRYWKLWLEILSDSINEFFSIQVEFPWNPEHTHGKHFKNYPGRYCRQLRCESNCYTSKKTLITGDHSLYFDNNHIQLTSKILLSQFVCHIFY